MKYLEADRKLYWIIALIAIGLLVFLMWTSSCGNDREARKIATDFAKGAIRDYNGKKVRVVEAQHIEVLKQPGDSTTIWLWNVPAASSFDGISLESSPVLAGPYTDMNLTILKTATSVTFPAPAAQTFYNPYYWKTVNGQKTRVSSSMNVVEVSIGAPPVPPIPPTPEPLGPAPVITAR